MKWFRVLDRDNVRGAFMDVDGVDFRDFQPSRLYETKRIDDWPDDVVFSASEYEAGERADDVLVTFNMVPVYSQRLQESIRGEGINDFQFLPCRVVNGIGKEIHGYAVANVLTTRSAFAPEHGRVLYFDETQVPLFQKDNINLVVREALFEEKTVGCHAFRITEDPLLLFVSSTAVSTS